MVFVYDKESVANAVLVQDAEVRAQTRHAQPSFQRCWFFHKCGCASRESDCAVCPLFAARSSAFSVRCAAVRVAM
eukprot:949807-Rhodomonas_salina.1